MESPLTRLVVAKHNVICQIRESTAAEWPRYTGDFLGVVRALDGAPPGAMLLAFAEVAHELAQLGIGCGDRSGSSAITSFDPPVAIQGQRDDLCDRFERHLRDWFAQRLPDSRGDFSASARRAAAYIRDRYSERLTLERLSDVAGCGPRVLSFVFRTEMGMSVRASRGLESRLPRLVCALGTRSNPSRPRWVGVAAAVSSKHSSGRSVSRRPNIRRRGSQAGARDGALHGQGLPARHCRAARQFQIQRLRGLVLPLRISAPGEDGASGQTGLC
jgi:AraC-like DNA-binding protein